MGCDSYTYKETNIRFSEMDDEVSCLCTFPHNNRCFNNTITPDQLRSLAYLGAMIVLIHQEEYTEPYVYLPNSLPNWIKDEIDKQIPINMEEE